MVQTYRHTASAARQPEMGCPMSPRMSLEERGARNVAHRPNPHAAVSAPAWQFQVSQSKAHLKLRFAIARSAAAVFLALIAATAVRADGRQVDAGPTGARGGSYQGVISHETVTVKKSQVIEINAPYATALVGEAEIADIVPLSDRALYIVGKKVGSTRLTVMGPNQKVLQVTEIEVTPDVGELRRKLKENLPELID